MNGPRECERKGPETLVPQAPTGSFSRPGLAIPCWVAPPQSPTLFHQAISIILQNGGLQSSQLQNRPNAPTGSCGFPAGVALVTSDRCFRQQNQNQRFNRNTPLPRIGIEEITSRRIPFTCRF